MGEEQQQETVSGVETVPGPDADTEAAIIAVLDEIREVAMEVKSLGSYPQAVV